MPRALRLGAWLAAAWALVYLIVVVGLLRMGDAITQMSPAPLSRAAISAMVWSSVALTLVLAVVAICLFSSAIRTRAVICAFWLALQIQVVLVTVLEANPLSVDDFSPLAGLAVSCWYLYGNSSAGNYFRALKQSSGKG